MNILKKLQNAVDRDVVVYDNKFGANLVYTLYNTSKLHRLGPLTHIYVYWSDMEKIDPYLIKFYKHCGINIISTTVDLTKEFKSLGGSLPYTTKTIILSLTKKKKAILGAF